MKSPSPRTSPRTTCAGRGCRDHLLLGIRRHSALSTVAVRLVELAPDSATCFTNLSCYGGDGEYTITTTDAEGVHLRHLGGRVPPDPIVLDVDGEG